MVDQRPDHDPFAPHPVPAAADDAEPTAADQTNGDGLENLTRAELVERAEQVGVATYGSKADLVDRIRLTLTA